MTFLQLFDQLLDRHARTVRSQRLAVINLTLQLAFGAQFFAEESDQAKWKGGRPPKDREIQSLLSRALDLATEWHEEEQESSADLATDDAEMHAKLDISGEKGDAHGQGPQDGSADADEDDTGEKDDVLGDDGDVDEGDLPPGQTADDNPLSKAASTHPVRQTAGMTVAETIYWLSTLLGIESQQSDHFDPERPAQVFYEKRWRVAQPQDFDDPRFHIVDVDAGAEDEERLQQGTADLFEDPTLKKNRLRGDAKGRSEKRGWYYHPKASFDRIQADLLAANAQLQSAEKETRFLRNRKDEERAVHELAEEAGRTARRACPVCFEDDFEVSGVLDPCLHAFCISCVHRLLAPSKVGLCPTCRHAFRQDQITSVATVAPPPKARVEDADVAGDYGAKIKGLIMDLRDRLAQDPTSKAVVFSSFRKFLGFVEDALLLNGIGAVRLGGSEDDQAQALASFRDQTRARVLLVPMKASEGAAGLTCE